LSQRQADVCGSLSSVQETRKSVPKHACQGRGREERSEGSEGKKDNARRSKRSGGWVLASKPSKRRSLVPRHPYRMLIKRVSTVSKYLTASEGEATVDRSARTAERVRATSHGIVFGEPWSLMYASGLARWSRGTVWVVHVLLPRHSPMLRALLCALYTLSLSFSPSFSLLLSLLFLSLFLLHFTVLLSSFRSPSFPSYRVIRTRETLSSFVPLPLSLDRTFRFPPRLVRLFPHSFLVT